MPTGSRYLRQFASITVGVSALVIGYSLIKSGGVTYNLGLLGLGGIILYFSKKTFGWSGNKSIWKDWIIFEYLLLYVFIFILNFVLNGDYAGNTSFFNTDMMYYAQISDALGTYGFENKNRALMEICEECKGLYPYHYFELWFNNLVVILFNLNSFISLKLIANIFFTTLAILGLSVYLNKYYNNFLILEAVLNWH